MSIQVAVRLFSTLIIIFSCVGLQAQGRPLNGIKRWLLSRPDEKVQVLTAWANDTPYYQQIYGTCYFDSILGCLQDRVLYQQIEAQVFWASHLYIARVVPTARLLAHRIDRFLRGELGQRTPEGALNLVSSGTADEAVSLIQNVDIPLFKFSSRAVESDAHELVRTTQVFVSELLKRGVSEDQIRQLVYSYLKRKSELDYKSQYNADTYYRVEFMKVNAEGESSISGTLRQAVEENLLIQAKYRTSGAFHAARVAGYWRLPSGEITDIILEDTGGFGDKAQSGKVTLSMQEFFAREGRIYRVQLSGRFIPQSEAIDSSSDLAKILRVEPAANSWEFGRAVCELFLYR